MLGDFIYMAESLRFLLVLGQCLLHSYISVLLMQAVYLVSEAKQAVSYL